MVTDTFVKYLNLLIIEEYQKDLIDFNDVIYLKRAIHLFRKYYHDNKYIRKSFKPSIQAISNMKNDIVYIPFLIISANYAGFIGNITQEIFYMVHLLNKKDEKIFFFKHNRPYIYMEALQNLLKYFNKIGDEYMITNLKENIDILNKFVIHLS